MNCSGAAGPTIALGLTDALLEGRLVRALHEAGATVERCLAGDALLDLIGRRHPDAILVDAALPRLSLPELCRCGPSVVVVTEQGGPDLLGSTEALTLQSGTPMPEIVTHILAIAGHSATSGASPVLPSSRKDDASTDGRQVAPQVRLAGVKAAPCSPLPPRPSSIVAIVSAAGGVGCTTLAINLAAALDSKAPTVLVDADLDHPCVAAYLAADILRNLAMLADLPPHDQDAWRAALDDELQPLHRSCLQSKLLLCLSRPEMSGAITPHLFEQALVTLGSQAGFVLLDLGACLDGRTSAARLRALELADRVLVVARADPVSLWQARSAWQQWQRELDRGDERVALTVTCYDRRIHNAGEQIARDVGLPVAAAIPEDHLRLQQASVGQEPLVFQRRAPAAKAILALADDLLAVAAMNPSSQRARPSGWWSIRPLLRPHQVGGKGVVGRVNAG